jgi:GW (Gly-Tryp) dipeptide domain
MKLNIFYASAIIATVISCNNGPKVITASTSEPPKTTSGIFSEEPTTESPNLVPSSNGSFTDNLHTVVATETLNTKKYVYINVTEEGKQFWIATAKQPIDIGKTYYYRSPLLKTNFESREHNRVFDTIYLVSNLVSHNHGTGNLKADFSETNTTPESSQKQAIETHTNTPITHKGSIKIAELVANPKQYEGKTVQLSGRVTKVNPNIMNRNWLHLKDGSKDDYDLVITSNTFVPEGETITIKAKVSLNQDFGAGYRYDLILEDGILIK